MNIFQCCFFLLCNFACMYRLCMLFFLIFLFIVSGESCAAFDLHSKLGMPNFWDKSKKMTPKHEICTLKAEQVKPELSIDLNMAASTKNSSFSIYNELLEAFSINQSA